MNFSQSNQSYTIIILLALASMIYSGENLHNIPDDIDEKSIIDNIGKKDSLISVDANYRSDDTKNGQFNFTNLYSEFFTNTPRDKIFASQHTLVLLEDRDTVNLILMIIDTGGRTV